MNVDGPHSDNQNVRNNTPAAPHIALNNKPRATSIFTRSSYAKGKNPLSPDAA